MKRLALSGLMAALGIVSVALPVTGHAKGIGSCTTCSTGAPFSKLPPTAQARLIQVYRDFLTGLEDEMPESNLSWQMVPNLEQFAATLDVLGAPDAEARSRRRHRRSGRLPESSDCVRAGYLGTIKGGKCATDAKDELCGTDKNLCNPFVFGGTESDKSTLVCVGRVPVQGKTAACATESNAVYQRLKDAKKLTPETQTREEWLAQSAGQGLDEFEKKVEKVCGTTWYKGSDLCKSFTGQVQVARGTQSTPPQDESPAFELVGCAFDSEQKHIYQQKCSDDGIPAKPVPICERKLKSVAGKKCTLKFLRPMVSDGTIYPKDYTQSVDVTSAAATCDCAIPQGDVSKCAQDVRNLDQADFEALYVVDPKSGVAMRRPAVGGVLGVDLSKRVPKLEGLCRTAGATLALQSDQKLICSSTKDGKSIEEAINSDAASKACAAYPDSPGLSPITVDGKVGLYCAYAEAKK